MVCKEDVVTWFKESSSYKRIDLMCSLLNMCLPFELRFLGTCVEDLGKRDFHDLREAENRANNLSVLTELQSVSDKRTRRNVAIYLSLLHSSNHACSNALYKILSNFDYSEINTANGSVSDSDSDAHPLEELLLLYTMALNHPAFTYEQKTVFGSTLQKLEEKQEEDKLCSSKNVDIYINPQIQVNEIDPSLLTCGANQYSYVQPAVATITAIPVCAAPDRKAFNQNNATPEMAHKWQRWPQTRQQHLPEDTPLQVYTNCRSVPSPVPSPTSTPQDDATPPVAPNSPPLFSPTTTVMSYRVNRRRQQSSSPGMGEAVEGGEGPPRAPRSHRGGNTGQRRSSPKRHPARARGTEQAPAKDTSRYGSQLRDAEEGSEETGSTEPEIPERQSVADLSEAQHIGTCHNVSSPLNESAISKKSDAGRLQSSSPPASAPQLDEPSIAKNRLCVLEEGDGINLIDGRPMVPPQNISPEGARPEASPEEDSTVQSMQWVRANMPSATAAPMAPRQPCPPHARPTIQRAFSNCNSARSSEQGGAVPSSPSSAFSSSSSLSSSSSSSSSSGVSPQPQVPPSSSVPYTHTPSFHLSHLLPPPPIRFPATTFAPGFLPTSGGATSGAGAGGSQPISGGSYLPPGSGGPPVRHSFPFVPNGLNPGDLMYASVTAAPPPTPQYHMHTGHHPRVAGGPAVIDHSTPPPMQPAGYATYIMLSTRPKNSSCFNCGAHTHRGTECRELTMEEITRPGLYRLEYSMQKSPLVGSVGGGGPGGTSSGGENAGGVVDE